MRGKEILNRRISHSCLLTYFWVIFEGALKKSVDAKRRSDNVHQENTVVEFLLATENYLQQPGCTFSSQTHLVEMVEFMEKGNKQESFDSS